MVFRWFYYSITDYDYDVILVQVLNYSKLWDHALDLGWKAVLGLKMLSRAMSHHGRGERACHLCHAVSPLQEASVATRPYPC